MSKKHVVLFSALLFWMVLLVSLDAPILRAVQTPTVKTQGAQTNPPRISSVTPNAIKIVQGGSEIVTLKGSNLKIISSVQVLLGGQSTRKVSARLLEPRSSTEQKVEFAAAEDAQVAANYGVRVIYGQQSQDIPSQNFRLEIISRIQKSPTKINPDIGPILPPTISSVNLPNVIIQRGEIAGPRSVIIMGTNLGHVIGTAIYLNNIKQKEADSKIESGRTDNYLTISMRASLNAIPGKDYKLFLGYLEKENDVATGMPSNILYSTAGAAINYKMLEVPLNITIDITTVVDIWWTDIIAPLNNYLKGIGILIHTRGKDWRYENRSYINLPDGQHTLDIPLIEFEKNILGKFRYLIRYLYCGPDNIVHVTKEGCNNNQLMLVIPFESEGVELIGYRRSDLFNDWTNSLAPDINIDNGKLTMKFNFRFNNGQVDFWISDAKFDCKIYAEHNISQDIMDLFNGHWEKDTKKKINNAIQNAINSQSIQLQTANIWINSIINSMELNAQLTLKSIVFMPDKIRFTVSY